MSPNNMDIRVAGQEVKLGLFQMTLNTSDKSIGDVKATSLNGFFDAAANAVHRVHPERSVIVTVTTLDNDVQESPRYLPRLDIAA